MRAHRLVLFVAFLSFVCRNAYAHHAFATHYLPTMSLELQGEVVEFNLRSPHSSMLIDVTGEDGSVKRWEVEAGALPNFKRMGVDEDTFKPGDTITVIAWPNRVQDNPLVYGIGFITGDGESFGKPPDLSAGVSLAEVSGVAAVAGRWSVPIPVRSTKSPLPLNSAGLEAWENYDPQNSPANTCEPGSIPGILYGPLLNDIQITEQEVVFHHEAYNVHRTIPLNSRPRLVELTGIMGMASAQIEGDTLVIESSDYPASNWGLALAGHTNGGGADVPSSLQKKVVERYSASDDGLTLTIEYTVEDPVYLTEPYTGAITWNRVADDEPMYPFDCEVDSAQRFSRDP